VIHPQEGICQVGSLDCQNGRNRGLSAKMAATSKYRAKHQNIILLFFLFDIQGSFGRIPIYLVDQLTRQKEKKMNNLDTIMSAMRTGKYGTIVDPNGNVHVGIINGILREDGSGKNWIVTVTNQTASKKVFIYAK
jgi:hypothetical protein